MELPHQLVLKWGIPHIRGLKMKMAARRVLILFLSLFLSRATPLSFSDITKDVFSTNSGDVGRIVGFGDLNNDRNTDILCASGECVCQWCVCQWCVCQC